MVADAVTLRLSLVSALVQSGAIRSVRVAAALRAVPRHLFAPWLPLAQAYADQAWPIPETTLDAPATISQPYAVAMMLEAFNIQPGQRVLEIGAGTGYNAALMAHLVGETGRVTTVDIEPHLVKAAKDRLSKYTNIQMVQGDGGYGFPAGAPYDRIVATVGAWDIPPAWSEQLAPDGQLVIPLHLGGEPQNHELIAFRRQGQLLVGDVVDSLQMVLLRGDYAHRGAEHGQHAPTQRGLDWQASATTGLCVTAVPHGMEYQLQPYEMSIEKPSVRLILARRTDL